MVESFFGNVFKFKRTKISPDANKKYKILLPKGSGLTYSELTSIQKISFKIFGKYAEKNKNMGKLGEDLLKAHMLIRPQEYIAYVYFLTMAIAIPLLIIFLLMILLGNMILSIIVLMALVVVPVIIYILMIGNPSSIAKTRGKKIEGKLPATMNFISALASADVNVDMIFKEMAKRPEYGEVAKESEWITRDTELLGKDILTALKDGAKRSPSQKWSEFLQGVVTTSTSGGRLKPYFIAKGEEYENELKLQMKRTTETISLFAESFVTVGVAFPLFLIIIVAIMALISPTPGVSMILLYFVVFIMLPILIIMFAWIIKSTSEVAS